MIFGTGIDLLEMERIQKACSGESFVNRIFTEAERREASTNVRRLAGDFVVKEAVAKAFGTGFRGFGPAEIEVLRDAAGKPYVTLYGGAAETAAKAGITNIQVSISDTETFVTAVAVAECAG